MPSFRALIWHRQRFGSSISLPVLPDQSPVPLGLADLKMSPLSPEAKAKVNQDLWASITDQKVLSVVTGRLDRILSNDPPNWDEGDKAGTD